MRASTLFAFLGVIAAIGIALLVWRIQQLPITVEIEPDAVAQINWDRLDPRLAAFIRQVQGGKVAGSLASEYQDVLDVAQKVEVREYNTVYEFPPLATPATRADGILCWPQLYVYVHNDSGVMQRISLFVFCF